jgi:hypothetical protein
LSENNPMNYRPAFDSCMSCLYVVEHDNFPDPNGYSCCKHDFVMPNTFGICDDYSQLEVGVKDV